MSTDIDIHSRYSVIASVTAMVLSVLFIVTACSTFISAREASHQNALAAAHDGSATSEAVVSTSDAKHSPAIDKTMDEWEKARATYLRTLDYSQIDQQTNDRDEYLLKSDLIESRYHIKTSETAMYVEQDFRKALAELRVAEHRFNQAVKLASPAELNDLEATKPNLDDLLKKAVLSMEHGCVYPQSSRYHQVEAKLENLLVKL